MPKLEPYRFPVSNRPVVLRPATVDPRRFSVRPILEPASRPRMRLRGLGLAFLLSGSLWTSIIILGFVLVEAMR